MSVSKEYINFFPKCWFTSFYQLPNEKDCVILVLSDSRTVFPEGTDRIMFQNGKFYYWSDRKDNFLLIKKNEQLEEVKKGLDFFIERQHENIKTLETMKHIAFGYNKT